MFATNVLDQRENLRRTTAVQLQRVLADPRFAGLLLEGLRKAPQALDRRTTPVMDGLAHIANHPERLGVLGELLDELHHREGHVLVLVDQDVLKLVGKLSVPRPVLFEGPRGWRQ